MKYVEDGVLDTIIEVIDQEVDNLAPSEHWEHDEVAYAEMLAISLKSVESGVYTAKETAIIQDLLRRRALHIIQECGREWDESSVMSNIDDMQVYVKAYQYLGGEL